VFELEKQINNLVQNQKKQEAIRKIQQQLNKLAQELEIKLVTAKLRAERKKPAPSPNKTSVTKRSSSSNRSAPVDNSPSETNENNPPQTFQTLRSQAQELIALLDKIIQDYDKRLKDFDKANEQAKEQGFDMDQGPIGEIMKSIKHHLEIAKRNKSTLEGYVSEEDYQTFLKASSETQQSNIELIEDAVKHTIKSTQENLSNTLKQALEMAKVAEGMFQGLEESGASNEEIQKSKKELEEGKKTMNDCQTKLSELEEHSTEEQIKTLGEV
jgi:hypothetical protein